MSLHVIEPGLHSLIVDFGRPAHRSLGVPVGGTADRVSLALGNALVGNSPETPALEITAFGPTLRADADTGAIVFGAPFDLVADRHAPVAGKCFTLTAGELLRIGGAPRGLRAYLCVPGGFTQRAVLGSRSALRPLRAGDTLACPPGRLPARALMPDAPSSLSEDETTVLRFLPGSQADWFEPPAFTGQTFRVSAAGNRMGLRLAGTPLARPVRELVSEPVCPGTVQVTNDGQCVVLGVDAQTIGGYPKIAQVIAADLNRLGQQRPGSLLRFTPVTLDEAEALARRQAAELHGWLARLAAVCN
ncbi:MAG: biotin-dependent carboxyltransferase family protein [Gemmataceae bacterium]